MPESSTPFATSLREARQKLGLSLREAESFLRQNGVSVSERTLGSYERGITVPSEVKQSSILDALSRQEELPGGAPRIPTEAAKQIAGASGDSLTNTHVLPLIHVVLGNSVCARVSLLVETADVQQVGLEIPFAAG